MKQDDRIYADYNATTPIDPRVFAKMEPYFGVHFGNPHSSEHSFGWQAAKVVEDSLAVIADILSVDADEIIVTSGATESNNLAIQGLMNGRTIKSYDQLLIGSTEHSSIFECAQSTIEKQQSAIGYIKCDSNGNINNDHLSYLLEGNFKYLASVEAVNGEIGTIQDISTIHQILADRSIPLHCDASQAPCALEIKTIVENCELMSLSSHKIYGPKGIGLLYVRRDLQKKMRPLFHGGGQQRNIRPGTIPVPLLVGFAEALKIVSFEGDEERKRIAQIRDGFLQSIRDAIPEVSVNGPDLDKRHPGNINLRFPGVEAEDLLLRLQPTIAASTGSACSSGIPEPSRVLRSIGLTRSEAESSMRFCFGRFSDQGQAKDAALSIVNTIDAMINS